MATGSAAVACALLVVSAQDRSLAFSQPSELLRTLFLVIAVAVGAFGLLRFLRRAYRSRFETSQVGPDWRLSEAAAFVVGIVVVCFLVAALLHVMELFLQGSASPDILALAMAALVVAILPGSVISLSGGSTPWQTRVRTWRLHHPWLWGAVWGALAFVTAPLYAGLSSQASDWIGAAGLLAAMHGYQAIQDAARRVLT
jgi:uncharacterized membrane protein YidH (DUF202 family)